MAALCRVALKTFVSMRFSHFNVLTPGTLTRITGTRALSNDSGDDSSHKTTESKEDPELVLSKPVPKKRLRSEKNDNEKGPKLSPEIVEAAEEVGRSIGKGGDSTTSDLLNKLRSHMTDSRAQGSDKSTTPMSNILSGVKYDLQQDIQRSEAHYKRSAGKDDVRRPSSDSSRSDRGISGEEQEYRMFRRRGPGREGTGRDSSRFEDQRHGKFERRRSPPMRPVHEQFPELFNGPRLGIFDAEDIAKSKQVTTKETLFDRLEREEMERSVELPPENRFDEMIKWTKEGKLWKLPINNEDGIEGQDVSFYDHVFLDQHLEGFPTRGPIRHFMELVTVGLSQNPYLTVEDKKDHIYWYQNYFDEKKAIIEDAIKAAEEKKRLEAS